MQDYLHTLNKMSKDTKLSWLRKFNQEMNNENLKDEIE